MGTIKFVAWLLLLSIIVLSVVPPTSRPVTVLSHGIEHLAMFLVTGLALGIAYASRYRHTFALVLFAVGFAAGVELFQLLIPGRHARVSDFIVDASGLCVGVIFGTWWKDRLATGRLAD
jgi:VanZ family protein